MNRRIVFAVCALGCLLAYAPPTRAAVNVERTGNENPLGEIVRSIEWGAAGGTLIGFAMGLASDDNNGDSTKWGFIIGTFGGLGYGIYHVSTRPKAAALLEFEGGGIHTSGLAAIEGGPTGLRVRLAGVHF